MLTKMSTVGWSLLLIFIKLFCIWNITLLETHYYFSIWKPINIIYLVVEQRIKITWSLDAEKAFDKFCHPFMIKILNKLWIEGNIPSLIKDICGTLTSHLMVKTESFPLKIRNKTRMAAFTISIQHCSEGSRQGN